MKEAPIPKNDQERLDSLHSLNILDTPSEERFDRISRIAQKLLNVEIVLISLVDKDRQWFKSKVGLDADETPRNISFCGHAILSDQVFIVPNAKKDDRFKDNPLVTENPHIRLYAGKPLLGPEAQKLGTLCAIDSQPRELSEDEKQVLEDLSKWVEMELNAADLSQALETTREKIGELERLNKVMVDRELKMVELKEEIKGLKEKLGQK